VGRGGALTITALLAGVGAGLFIDEVGKFLTQSNDYFYAPAAPIIYGSILLLVLLWVVVRRAHLSRYDATRAIVEALGDGVDGRLTARSRQRVVSQLREAEVDSDPSRRADDLAEVLVTALGSPAMDARLTSEGWIARGDARRLLERIVPTRVERWLVIISLLLAVIVAVIAIAAMAAGSDALSEAIGAFVEEAGRLEIPTEPVWLLIALAINVVVGIAAVIALVLLHRGCDRARAAAPRPRPGRAERGADGDADPPGRRWTRDVLRGAVRRTDLHGHGGAATGPGARPAHPRRAGGR